MKLLRLALILIPAFGFGQADTNLLRVENHWYGQRFYKGAQVLKLGDLIDLSEGDQASHDLFRQANNRHDFARFSQIAGSFLIVYPFINQAIGRDPNWNMVYIGTGLWALSIPVELSARHKAIQGTLSYNNSRQSRKVQLKVDPFLMRVVLKF